MLYRSQCVDGVLDVVGGQGLAQQRAAVDRMLRVGEAVATGSLNNFRFIVHSVAPYYSSSNWATELFATYGAALDLAASLSSGDVALPLLGAGTKGAPVDRAAAVAVRAILAHDSHNVLRFACLDDSTATILSQAFSDSHHHHHLLLRDPSYLSLGS